MGSSYHIQQDRLTCSLGVEGRDVDRRGPFCGKLLGGGLLGLEGRDAGDRFGLLRGKRLGSGLLVGGGIHKLGTDG